MSTLLRCCALALGREDAEVVLLSILACRMCPHIHLHICCGDHQETCGRIVPTPVQVLRVQ